MHFDELNALSTEDAAAAFLRCCGSRRWAERMAVSRPFSSPAQMAETGDAIWWALGRADWLEAFAAHPRIGDGGPTREGAAPPGREKDRWASQEQAGMNAAGEDVRLRLAEANQAYQRRFGHIFIVCATGKSADTMLGILESRLSNPPDDEVRVAAGEQRLITNIRLAKLLDPVQEPDRTP